MNGLETQQLPPRTRLYQLKPEGIGTPCIESLSSYISRLAEAHCIPVGILLTRELGPSISSRTFAATTTWTRVGHTMNGPGEHARRCVDHIERLTMQKKLAALTFLGWSGVLGTTHLLRTKKAWCDRCFSDWRTAGRVIYEPLLWTCEQVHICPIHNVRLQHHCPHEDCQSSMPLLTSWPGHCSQCGRWLGQARHSDQQQVIQEDNDLTYARWAAEMVGQLLAPTEEQTLQQDPYYLARALSACAYHIQRLARKYRKSPIPGYSFSRLKEMSSRIGGIQLDTLLHICYHLHITPWYFLSQYSIASHSMSVLPPSPSRHLKTQRRRQPTLQHLTAELTRMLQQHEVPSPSLAEIARRLNTTASFLRRHFRPFCEQLTGKQHEIAKDEDRRREELRKAVQEAANRL